MRKNGFSKGVAALATFIASGVLHEYVVWALSLKKILLADHTAYTPRYGYHLIFFIWNGIVLSLENLLSKHPVFQWMSKNLPKPIITAFVIMTVLPVGHWFTGKSFGIFYSCSLRAKASSIILYCVYAVSI